MTTNARTQTAESSHFYTADAQPLYEIPRADGKGLRKFTLADARKMDPKPLPSVTTVLKILHKQALVDWLIEQACLALMTTPRLPNEPDDAFVQRVLHTERVQDQEAQAARDRGTEIHAALDDLFCGRPISAEIEPWVRPAFLAVQEYGELAATEKILVGDGYAGKTDLIQFSPDPDEWWLWDWKTTKKLPDPSKGAYAEHRLQNSAYCAAWRNAVRNNHQSDLILTGNIYISTIDCGKFVVCEHQDWQETYQNGFAPLVKHWMWATGYTC